MADHLARAEDFDSKAEKKLSGWGLFGSKYDDAADLFDKAANSYKLSKSCIANRFSPYDSSFYFSLFDHYFPCFVNFIIPKRCCV